MNWTNLDHPHMSEGWAYPNPNGKCHYFREGRSLCGRCTLPVTADTAGSLTTAEVDDCLTCGDMALAEAIRNRATEEPS